MRVAGSVFVNFFATIVMPALLRWLSSPSFALPPTLLRTYECLWPGNVLRPACSVLRAGFCICVCSVGQYSQFMPRF